MDVYTRLDPATGCSPQRAFTDLVELWAAGVLPEDATVWMDAGVVEPVLWALTDHSSLVYLYRPPSPGWVVVTKGRVRWGRTHKEAKDAPVLDLMLDRFPGGVRRRVMFVVASAAMTQNPVGVIADGKVQKAAISGGRFIHPATGVTVIDLPAAQAAHRAAPEADRSDAQPAGAIEAGSAMYAGLELLTAGLDPAAAAAVQAGLSATPSVYSTKVLTDLYAWLVETPQVAVSMLAGILTG